MVAASKDPIMTWRRQKGRHFLKKSEVKLRTTDDQNIVVPVDAPRARAFTTCPTV